MRLVEKPEAKIRERLSAFKHWNAGDPSYLESPGPDMEALFAELETLRASVTDLETIMEQDQRNIEDLRSCSFELSLICDLLRAERDELKTQVTRLHEKYDYQVLVNQNARNALKAECEAVEK